MPNSKPGQSDSLKISNSARRKTKPEEGETPVGSAATEVPAWLEQSEVQTRVAVLGEFFAVQANLRQMTDDVDPTKPH